MNVLGTVLIFGAGYAVGRASSSRRAGDRQRTRPIGSVANAMLSIHGVVEQNPALFQRLAESGRLSFSDAALLSRTLT